jgi:hypothetical protein
MEPIIAASVPWLYFPYWNFPENPFLLPCRVSARADFGLLNYAYQPKALITPSTCFKRVLLIDPTLYVAWCPRISFCTAENILDSPLLSPAYNLNLLLLVLIVPLVRLARIENPTNPTRLKVWFSHVACQRCTYRRKSFYNKSIGSNA